MTRDDIIEMAKEAGHPFLTASVVEQGAGPVPEWLERFADLVAAAEREACAEVCYGLGNDSSIDDHAYEAFREAEETIRARGEGKS